MDKNRADNTVQPGCIRQESLIPRRIVGADLLDFGGHSGQVPARVQDRSIRKKIAGQGLYRLEKKIIFHVPANGRKQVFKNLTHGDHRRAGVPTEAGCVQLAHLPADLLIFFQNQDLFSRSLEANGGA